MRHALARALPFLACPICGSAFATRDASLVCASGHSYDVARAGYVNMAVGKNVGTGDTAAMVLARDTFLTAGWFDPITAALVDAVGHVDLAVDLAGGTGHYLAGLLTGSGNDLGVCVDLSSAALKRAAACHEGVAAVGADVWQRLPFTDDAADLVLSVFGPRNAAEIERVLRPGGLLLVVTPTEAHLAELRARLGLLAIGESKPERLDASFARFTLLDRATHAFPVTLAPADLVELVMMGPNAHHQERSAVLTSLGEGAAEVTVSVQLSVFRRFPAS